MTDTTHPAPQRHRVSLAALAIGLVGAPAAWAVQLLLNYGLSSYSCYPQSVSRTTVASGFGAVWVWLLIINLLALLSAAGATYLSFRNWQITREEHPGSPDDLVEAGEGRTRFIGLAGAIAGVGFTLALIFDLVAILGAPLCRG